MKKLLWTAAIVALGTGTALGADMPLRMYTKAPAPIAIYNWTGLYIGIEGGGSWGSSKHVDQFTGLDDAPWFDVNGGLVGGTAGFNWQTGGFVVGVEGDWSWADQKGSSPDTGPAGEPNLTSFTNEKWLATARGRLGYAVNNVLIYATGGYAAAGVDVGIKETATGVVDDQTSQTRSGWTAGGGIEWGFAPNWSAKVEYLYVSLQDTGFVATNLGSGFNRSSVPLNDNIVRAGINLHFGGPAAK